MRRMAVVMVVLGLAASWSGCGGGADYSSPKATFQTLWNAAKAGNRDGVIACFTDPVRMDLAGMLKMEEDSAKGKPEIKGKMGGGVIAKIQEGAKKTKVEIGAEKITGTTAILEVTMDGEKRTMSLIQEAGAWKFNSLKPAMVLIEKGL